MPILPKILRYRGSMYKRVDAAIAAKAAETKVRQVQNAMDRTPKGNLVNKDEWVIGDQGLLDAKNIKDGGEPMLVMWNPLTSEVLVSSDQDTDVINHHDLLKKYRSKVVDYPFAHMRDWGRASIDRGKKVVVLWQWTPLYEYVVYLSSPNERGEMERLHRQGLAAFKTVITDLGVPGYGFNTLGA